MLLSSGIHDVSEWIPSTIYSLCLLASVLCATLLVRGYIKTKVRLLLWSAACFVMLAINNLLLVIDLVMLPTSIDLSEERVLASIAGLLMLIYGFIWEVE
jgi:hypothetical protein